MLPLSLLKVAEDQPMLIELKNGDTYNGRLVSCNAFMNICLKDVICTSKNGDKFWKMPECYIRGNTIKYLRIPDEIIHQVAEDEQEKRRQFMRGSAPRGGGRSSTGGRFGGRGRGSEEGNNNASGGRGGEHGGRGRGHSNNYNNQGGRGGYEGRGGGRGGGGGRGDGQRNAGNSGGRGGGDGQRGAGGRWAAGGREGGGRFSRAQSS